MTHVEPTADLTRLHVVVPVRSVSGGKVRLGAALDAEERETLIVGMLRHALTVLRAWGVAEAVHVVSQDVTLLAHAVGEGADPVLQDGRGGLNAAIVEGRTATVAAGGSAMLVLPADLPALTVASLERLMDAADAALAAGSGRPVVVLAPADARGGTNALLVSPPDVIAPCFGAHSLEAHASAAARADATLQLVVDAALGFDLDTPEDVDRLGVEALERLVELGSVTASTTPQEPATAHARPA